MATEYTLLTDSDGNTILPFTDAEVVATQSGRSSLSKDLQSIESHMKGVKEGVVVVDHAKRANRWNKPIRFEFVGGATGSAEFDGSGNVEVQLTTSTHHLHEIEQIEGLEATLSKKAPLTHTHEGYQDYNQIVVRSGKYTQTFQAGPGQREFRLTAGENIRFDVDESSQEIVIKADVVSALIERAQTADALRQIKIDSDANRSNNERYVLTATYGEYSPVGSGIDFHVSNSRKAFDGRFGITLNGQLVYQREDKVHHVFHEGFMGANSKLDADLLDGRHGSEYALRDHEHSDYALALHEHTEVGALTNALTLYALTKEVQLVDAGGGRYDLYHTGRKPTAKEVGALPSNAGCATLSVKDGYLANHEEVEAILIKQADNATAWGGYPIWVGQEAERPGVGIQFCLAETEEMSS